MMAEVEQSVENRAVMELLSSLVGMDVEVEDCDDANEIDGKGFVSSYATETGDLHSFCVCDLAFSNSAGAALARIPNGFASDSTKEGECPENVQENLSEVLNVFSILARGDQPVRLKLQTIFGPASEIPDNAKEKIASNTKKTFRVAIAGYDPGLLTLYSPQAE